MRAEAEHLAQLVADVHTPVVGCDVGELRHGADRPGSHHFEYAPDRHRVVGVQRPEAAGRTGRVDDPHQPGPGGPSRSRSPRANPSCSRTRLARPSCPASVKPRHAIGGAELEGVHRPLVGDVVDVAPVAAEEGRVTPHAAERPGHAEHVVAVVLALSDTTEVVAVEQPDSAVLARLRRADRDTFESRTRPGWRGDRRKRRRCRPDPAGCRWSGRRSRPASGCRSAAPAGERRRLRACREDGHQDRRGRR